MPMHADFAKPATRRWLARNRPSRICAALMIPVLKFDLWYSGKMVLYWTQMQAAVPQELSREAQKQANVRKSLDRARRALGL